MTRLLTILGARPQCIKAAALHHALAHWRGAPIRHHMLHTGQHYDDAMSGALFREFGLPMPEANLHITEKDRATALARMQEAIAAYLQAHDKPDWVIVHGDTNSTLAAARAAHALGIPLAHVEAGLRSYNPAMPEEENRVQTDQLASLLFCPTPHAVSNLQKEGIAQGVRMVGDVMLDIARLMRPRMEASDVLARLGLEEKNYILATCHRAENTSGNALHAILAGLAELAGDMPVVMPLHPRTKQAITTQRLETVAKPLRLIEPQGYTDMARLTLSAKLVATDSGGLQKEAYFHRTPCVTLRGETEWPETLEGGCNRLAPPAQKRIAATLREALETKDLTFGFPYGDGHAAGRILAALSA